MAKNSIYTKRSLKRLFSKSEANLKESTEKYESNTRSKPFKLFKWKKKRNTNTEDSSVAIRAETPEADSVEEHEGENGPDGQSSIYATIPRSKKVRLTQSETDLRKPKRFPTFNLGWRKKKAADFSKIVTSLNKVSEVKGSIWEQENKCQEIPVQASGSQQESHRLVEPEATPTAPPLILTDQSQVQDGQNDRPRSNAAGSMEVVVPAVVGFMPANTDDASILYIDESSDSDGCQTPPVGPGFATTNLATPKTLNIPLATKDFTVKSHSIAEALPEVVETDFRSTDSVLSPVHHLSESTVTGGMDHYLSLSDLESQKGGRSNLPLKATTTESTFDMVTHEKAKESSKGQMGSDSISTTFSTSVFPQSSLIVPPEQSSSCSTATEQDCHGDESVQLQDVSSICSPQLEATSSKTCDPTLDPTASSYAGSNNVTVPNYDLTSTPTVRELSHSGKETKLVKQASPEPNVTSSLSSNTFNKVPRNTLPSKGISATTAHLTTVASDRCPSSLNKCQEANIGKLIHLQNYKAGESGEENQLVVRELISGSGPTPGPTGHSKLVQESRTLISDLQTLITTNNDLYDLHSSKVVIDRCESERDDVAENPVKVGTHEYDVELSSEKYWRGEEYLAMNQQIDTVEMKYEAGKMLESFEMTKSKPQNAIVKTVDQHTEVKKHSERENVTVGGKAFQHLPDLATPEQDVPVQQARVSEECVAASPWSPKRDVSVTGRSQATRPDLAVGTHPSLMSGWPITRGGAKGNAVSLSAETEDNSAPEHATPAAGYRVVRVDTYRDFTVSAGERDSRHRSDSGPPPESHKPIAEESTTTRLLPVVKGTLQQAPELEKVQDAGSTKAEAAVTGSTHKGPPVHADKGQQGGLCDPSLCSKNTAFHSTEKPSSSPETSASSAGIIVSVREFALDNSGQEKDSQPTGVSALSDHLPASAHISSADKFSHTCPALSTVTEESDTQSPTVTVPGSDTEMSSGFSLMLSPRVGLAERDSLQTVHKVSLVGDCTDSSKPLLSSAQENGLKGAGSELANVGRFLSEDFHSILEESDSPPAKRSDTMLVNSTYTHSSVSSTKREPVLFASHSFLPEKAPPSAVSLDTASSPGNGSCWNVRSEVQQGSESEAGRRSWAEFAAPAGGRGKGSETGITNAGSGSYAQLAESGSEHDDDFFTGIFTATRVELPASPTDTDPDPIPNPDPDPDLNMEALVDTLRSMESPSRNRTMQRASTQPFSSLPPIREDIPSPVSAPASSPTVPKETSISLPLDLGLNWSVTKDMRSPLTMMKGKLDSEGKGRTIILPSRASAISSIVMRKGLPDLSVEEGAHLNGGSFLGTSRLDNSLLFSGYRPDQPDGIGKASSQRTLFRTASLPDVNQDHERLSGPPKGLDLLGSGVSRYDRLSFLTSPSHSLTGAAEQSRISRAPLFLHSPTMEVAALTSAPLSGLPLDAPVKYPTPPSLQRSLSSEGTSIRTPVCNDIGMDFGKSQEPRPERQFVTKYRAFPDAYRTKEKEHGKLNPRPGKMVIYDQPGLRGNWIEVHSDVIDATGWKLPESISIRVVRGGWVLYEKPEFKGKKIALDEGDIELTNLFGPQGNDQCPTQNGTGESGEDGSDAEPDQPRRFAIGSLRRAVRDYSVPEICLFPEEDAEGKKVIFRDTTDDARIYGFPIKANSIIINAGLWLVFAEPFFQGVPRVLEVGGFPKPKSWSDTEPYVSSLHPLKIGEPRVEKLNEPKLVIYEKPYFTGKSREIYTSARDFMTRESQQQTVVMYSAGSIKVIGGIWAGYEKEGFRGHQYLLEEGDYHDWRVWGGCDNELRSVRVIQTDLTEPMLVMFEMTNEEEDRDEERTFEVTEAVPDVELFGFRTVTRSIHVLSGAWVAYSHVDYSGNQYVLEKGFYNNCIDWGAEDNRICSIQPILRASAVGPAVHSELLLYSETGFQGLCQVYNKSHESFLKQPSVQSCRVMGGSWVLYDDTDFMGNQYVLSEGHYVNLTSMGCPSSCTIRSVKSVPMLFAVPSISLFGLECFEGREITLDTEVSNIMAEGFNPHFLSVRVNTGCWVLCEHTNYRGRQFLLEPIEITNWHKFSSISSIGSIYPIRTTRRLFRIRYKESGRFMSVQGGVDTLKSGRVVVSEHVEGMSDIWFYQDGLIKNKLAQNMSLQVIGNVESGAKVVLWSETSTPIQMWSAKLSGAIASLTFPGFVLDVKGGNTYDKEHVIVGNEAEENASELWELEFI